MTVTTRLSAIITGFTIGLATAPALAGTWSDLSAAGMQIDLYTPDAAPRTPAGRPLMLSLHGCLQTGDNLRQRGNWASTAEQYGMIVALPTVPGGGKIAGCWDYWGKPSVLAPTTPTHTRQNRDNDNILTLVNRLLTDPTLGIDPKQVYVSGLSSGGGQTLVQGCLAPDIFAGVGIVAGPSLGTASDEIKAAPLPVSRAQLVSSCKSLAGSNAPHLATQVTSVAFGSADSTVSPAYSQLNAEALAEIYGAAPSGSFDLSTLPGFQPKGQGSLWADATGPRVSLVRIDGMGHAWPAGSGPGGEPNFVALKGLNYPAYLTKFLTDNNRRLTPPAPSVTAAATVDPTAATVRVTGTASAADGTLDALTFELVGLSTPGFHVGPVSVPQPAPPAFDVTSAPLPANASYKALIRAVDAGAETVEELVFGVGPNPPFPPVLGDVISSIDRGCVALLGSVEDANNNLDRVSVTLDGANIDDVLLNVAAKSWALKQPVCSLQPGHHTAVVTAVDHDGLTSKPVEAAFDIPEPFNTVTDTLNGHVIAQRIRFYPQAGHFGTADVPFTTLVSQHGNLTPFPLFEIGNDFFATKPTTTAAAGPTPRNIPIVQVEKGDSALTVNILSDLVQAKQ